MGRAWGRCTGLHFRRVSDWTWSDVAILIPLAVAFVIGFLARRRRGWIALAGIAVAFVLWAVIAFAGGFEDDTEGTAAVLGLVYVVPLYAALWAGVVGLGYIAQRLLGKRRPISQ